METIKCSVRKFDEYIKNLKWAGNSKTFIHYMMPGDVFPQYVTVDYSISTVDDAKTAIISELNKGLLKKVLERSSFSYCIETGEELIDFKRYKPYIYAKS